MVATFVVEDGTGITGANAYISEAFADQFHENFGDPVAWSSAISLDKQQSIRNATQYLDMAYISRWKGNRRINLQSLSWPRNEVYDISGWAVSNLIVPIQVQNATAILALKSLNGELFLPDVVSTDRGIKAEKSKAGPIEDTVTYSGSKANFKFYSQVAAILRPLLISQGTRVRA